MVQTSRAKWRGIFVVGAIVLAAPSVLQARIERGVLSEVPAAVTTITAEELSRLPAPRNLEDLAFLEPGEPVVVHGQYAEVNLRGLPDSDRMPVDLPIRIGTTADGAPVSSFNMPMMVPVGRAVLHFARPGSSPFDQPVHLYAFLDAQLERDKLSSGQRARFSYDLDFGEGPGTIAVTITTRGPIVYQKNGVRQTLSIDRSGKARLVDTITALRGSPTGIPFYIDPQFSDLRLRSR